MHLSRAHSRSVHTTLPLVALLHHHIWSHHSSNARGQILGQTTYKLLWDKCIYHSILTVTRRIAEIRSFLENRILHRKKTTQAVASNTFIERFFLHESPYADWTTLVTLFTVSLVPAARRGMWAALSAPTRYELTSIIRQSNRTVRSLQSIEWEHGVNNCNTWVTIKNFEITDRCVCRNLQVLESLYIRTLKPNLTQFLQFLCFWCDFNF